MNILVTGGSGFLGSHIIDELIYQGNNVYNYDLIQNKYNKNVRNIIGTLEDRSKLDKSLKNIDIVFHLAANADIDKCSSNAKETFQNNLIGTINILDAMVKNKVKKIIFSSSIYVYSNFGSFYKISKKSCEEVILEYSKIKKISYTILRYGSLYGPRSTLSNGIYRYLSEIIKSKKVKYDGYKNDLREFIHVKDAARISSTVIKKEYNNKFLNISGVAQTKIDDMFKMFEEILRYKFKVNYSHSNKNHYMITPYSYNKELTKKLISTEYIELGQGILELIKDIDDKYQ